MCGDPGTLVDAVGECAKDTEHGGQCGQDHDDDARTTRRQQSDERMTDAQVAVDGNGGHDERRQRDVGGDEKHIESAEQVKVDVVGDEFDDDGERDDDETGAEVDDGQRDDEQRRDEVVLGRREDVEDDGVAGRAEHAEHRQHGEDDVHLQGGEAERLVVLWHRRLSPCTAKQPNAKITHGRD